MKYNKTMEEYKQYIENVKTIRNLSKLIIEDNDTNETIINKIKQNAKESYNYKTWDDDFLNRTLYLKHVEDITENEVKVIEDFASETFNYADSLDYGISYKLFELLFNYAKYHNDIPMYIKEAYNCGMALFYLNIKDRENGHSLFKKEITYYFKEGASFIDRFKEFDSETRQYIVRCAGNIKVCINRQTLKGCIEYYKEYDKAMSIINSKELREIDPSLKWDNFYYGMRLDELALLDYVRSSNDEKIASKLLDAAKYVYSQNITDDSSRLQNWRVEYFYYSTLYHNNQITLKELINKLIEIASKANPNDYSMSSISKNLSLKAFVLYYINKLNEKDKKEYYPTITSFIKEAYKYLDKLPGESYKHNATNAVRDLADIQSELDTSEKTDMMNYIVAFHKPTYVHSLMVAEISKALTACLLMNNPESLIGVLNLNSKEEILKNADKLINLAYNCGIYHDVGKNTVMSYININERKLIEEEFRCIKTHANSGFELLAKNKKNECFALAALYHHVYYDGKGGYPENLEMCPSFIKPIVDILSVADSIDAATDSIGRHYKYPKTLDALIEEFKAQKGTRYAPFVVDLFDNKDVRKRIDTIINVERLSIYMNVYHKGKTYTISTYSKEK